MDYVKAHTGHNANILTYAINGIHLQRIVPLKKKITFTTDTTTLSAMGDISSEVDCDSTNSAIIYGLYSNNTDVATIRIKLIDTKGEYVFSPEYTLQQTGRLLDSNYISKYITIDVQWYAKIAVYLGTAITGNLTCVIGV